MFQINNKLSKKYLVHSFLSAHSLIKYFLGLNQRFLIGKLNNIIVYFLKKTTFLNFKLEKFTALTPKWNFRGEYNLENLKLSRDHHKNQKTHPKGKYIFYLFFFH
jgi:hypothetical protein